MSDSSGFSLQQMVQAARLYYLDDVSKVKIAEELGVSRFKVARLLEAARAEGIVRIEVTHPGGPDAQRSDAIRRRWGLRHVLVMESDRNPELSDEDRSQRLAQAAGQLLQDVIEPTDVIGMPWSRMVSRVVPAFAQLPPVPVVQLSGALDLIGHGNATSSVDVVRDAARLSGGEPHVFYAPFAASDAEAAAVILKQASVAGTLAEAQRCSVAIVGVGAWSADTSTLHELAREGERAEIDSLGGIGEVAGNFIGANGETISPAFRRRLVTVDAERLAEIPNVIGIAEGAKRAKTLRAAFQAGLVNSCVIDTALADALLSQT